MKIENNIRIWDKEYSHFRELPDVYGDYQAQAYRTYGEPFNIDNFLNSDVRKKLKDGLLIIQKCSGILDSKGTPIFDGDILAEECDLDKDCMYGDETTYIRHSAVVFERGMFNHDEDNPFSLSMNTSKDADGKWRNSCVKVAGNIFENPELLK